MTNLNIQPFISTAFFKVAYEGSGKSYFFSELLLRSLGVLKDLSHATLTEVSDFDRESIAPLMR